MRAQLAECPAPEEFRSRSGPASDQLWTCHWEEIRRFEVIPGVPIEADKWVIPLEWASGGPSKQIGQRTFDFSTALPIGWDRDEDRAEATLRRLKRLAALFFLRTVRVGKKYSDPPKPSTILRNLKNIARAAKFTLSNASEKSPLETKCPDGKSIFSHLSPAEMERIKERCKNFGHAVIPRLNGLYSIDAFDDWPSSDVGKRKYDSPNVILPFNDEFTSAVCSAAMWTMDILGPELIACWNDLLRFTEQDQRVAKNSYMRVEFVKNWEGKFLKPGTELRYLYRLKTREEEGLTSAPFAKWPPHGRMGLKGMLSRLQEAHGILISFAIGPRDGEVTDLPRDCLKQVFDGSVLVGQTFKLSASPLGTTRHWPLPKVVVQAIEQQQQLAEALDPGGSYLFVPFARRESIKDGKRSGLNLASFAEKVALRDGTALIDICDGNANSHRFRKTVVRLAALSLVGANQILFDILGHRDPEMTLNYILSDPNLQDDIRQIAREANLVLAKDAITHSETNGGPAAERVDEFAKRLYPRSGPSELDIQELDHAAEVLSQGGRVMLVRPGILCTKTFNQSGPCTQRAGKPDIGNCDVGCQHRLELEAAKQDHRKSIEQILANIPPEGHFMRNWWQGQLVAHLMPFVDLRSEMLADSRVKDALKGAEGEALAQLCGTHDTSKLSAILEEATQ